MTLRTAFALCLIMNGITSCGGGGGGSEGARSTNNNVAISQTVHRGVNAEILNVAPPPNV